MARRERSWEDSAFSRARRNAPSIALSKDESILLSSSGDVICCRCRESAYPQQQSFAPTEDARWQGYCWQDDLGAFCCQADCDELSTKAQEGAQCTNWCSTATSSQPEAKKQSSPLRSGGLRGGSPAQVAPNVQDDSAVTLYRGPQNGSPRPVTGGLTLAKAQLAFRSQPLFRNTDQPVDDESIIPIRSFDYSHFAEGGNDMLPGSPLRKLHSMSLPLPEQHSQSATTVTFFHGIPTANCSFLHVKVTQVSAHPLGSHVLLTSSAGLLYSYGLNDCGQLGIGVRTPVTGFHRGYIMTPTIVTPLVENGGKAIACAAGVNHSLVVVMTEERRVIKSASFEPPDAQQAPPLSPSKQKSNNSTETSVYHQIYGFGRNDYMKIGLMSSKLSKAGDGGADDILLPHRVALRCKIQPTESLDGSVSTRGIFAIQASEEHSAALVRRRSGDVELYTWGNALCGSLGLPHPPRGLKFLCKESQDQAVHIVPVPTFVSSLSRSSNREAQTASLLLQEEEECPTQISLGRRCSFVLTSLGRCFSFGSSPDGMLGLGPKVTETITPSEVAFPKVAQGEKFTRISAGATHVLATTESGAVYCWGAPPHSDSEDADIDWSPTQLQFSGEGDGSRGTVRFKEACAGYDNSMFVTESGAVLTCGRNSGRLGLGDLKEPVIGPARPLFGGLRLWQTHRTKSTQVVLEQRPPVLQRAETMG